MITHLRRRILSLPLLVCLALVAVPLSATATPASAPERGRLVSVQHLAAVPAAALATTLPEAGFDAGVVRDDIDTYRLVYSTIDPDGRATTASGLVALPAAAPRDLRTVLFAHGTEITKTDAPSTSTDPFEPAPVWMAASAGFAAVAPDYLGLGMGPGPHPWMDVPSETTASIDLLRAARQFAPGAGTSLGHQVFLTGFSQGASAAMSVARALREDAAPWFRPSALAPVSGAYAWEGVEVPTLLGGTLEPHASMGYVSYLLVAWNRLHHFYASPGDVFQAPYDTTIPPLFDGLHTGQQLMAALPSDLHALLTPHAFDLLLHPTGRLDAAMDVASGTCAGWTPGVPVRLYVGGDGAEVPTENSRRCQAQLRAGGADASIVDVGQVDHLESNRLAAGSIVRWFEQLG